MGNSGALAPSRVTIVNGYRSWIFWTRKFRGAIMCSVMGRVSLSDRRGFGADNVSATARSMDLATLLCSATPAMYVSTCFRLVTGTASKMSDWAALGF